MPTYEYRCEACKKHFEIFHSIKETRKKCPSCGSGKLVQCFGPGAGFIFKGSGFYITDYRSPDYREKAKAESEKGSPASSESGKKADADKKSDAGKKADSPKKSDSKAKSSS